MGAWYSETLNTIVKKLVDNLNATPFLSGIIVFGILLLISSIITALAGIFITIGIVGLIQKGYRKAVFRFEKAKKRVEEIEAHNFKTFSYGINSIKNLRGNWNCKPKQFRMNGMIFKGYETYPHPITSEVYRKVEGPFCESCRKKCTRPKCTKLFIFPFAFRYKFPCGHSKYFLKETPYTIFSEAKERWFTGVAEIIEN